ncbi:MAG: HAMP domain-containing histidine kinase [Ruminococcus flavefaciens]|nr:HAMP domain-containing histidine kinase [Ruminococcus flavefaciens]
MRKKMKNNLSIKVFLWVFLALTVCSMLIYGIVLTVLPRQYQLTSDQQLDTNTELLVSKLQNIHYDDAVKEIYNFCIQNNVSAMLSDDNGTLSFGEIESGESTVATSNIAATVTFLGSKKEYALVISSLSQTADTILNLMLRFLPAVFVIIFLLSFLSGFICSKVIVSPIANISQISKRMASLDLTWRCDIETDDEIGVLASSLNTMAARLQGTMEELTDVNHKLMDDMDQLGILEEQRKNFFAAVSHELKTPLTILKGQIENMILGYGDYQNHDKYLPEALKAADDIEHLIGEIITISKMESMDLQDTLQEISLKQAVNDAVEMILPLAQEKDMQIHQNISADVMLSVNPNLWGKALSNIMGNAVRHSSSGGDVFISVKCGENGNALIIENTGASIPETDIPHMFTPFYRADQSRSKVTGGSGLGLYIVKTILDLHGMNYSLKNTEQGVAFFLYIS